MRGIQTRRERLVDLYVSGDLDKASYRWRSEELEAELHAAELAFADRLTHNTLVGIPTTYEALEELWGSKGIELSAASHRGCARTDHRQAGSRPGPEKLRC